ncbi:MAG: flagellar basal body FlgE domain-containing protein [Bdellovibrionota bacterium]
MELGLVLTGVNGSAVGSSTDTYSTINNLAEFQTVVDVFDSLGAKHSLTIFFFRDAASGYTARAYASSDDVDTESLSNSGYLVK